LKILPTKIFFLGPGEALAPLGPHSSPSLGILDNAQGVAS